VRGSLSAHEFEQWLYQTPELEFLLGIDLYLIAIGTDFRDTLAVQDLRSRLSDWLVTTHESKCLCLLWPDSHRCVLGSETHRYIPDQFGVVRERNPWVKLVRCRGCLQAWYAAIDTVYDELHFVRLSEELALGIIERGSWPPHFDRITNVWPSSQ
jgi:hypothetical protein